MRQTGGGPAQREPGLKPHHYGDGYGTTKVVPSCGGCRGTGLKTGHYSGCGEASMSMTPATQLEPQPRAFFLVRMGFDWHT